MSRLYLYISLVYVDLFLSVSTPFKFSCQVFDFHGLSVKPYLARYVRLSALPRGEIRNLAGRSRLLLCHCFLSLNFFS